MEVAIRARGDGCVVGLPVARVVNIPAAPTAAPLRLESVKKGQSADRPFPLRGVGIVNIARQPIFAVQRFFQPHNFAAKFLAAIGNGDGRVARRHQPHTPNGRIPLPLRKPRERENPNEGGAGRQASHADPGELTAMLDQCFFPSLCVGWRLDSKRNPIAEPEP